MHLFSVAKLLKSLRSFVFLLFLTLLSTCYPRCLVTSLGSFMSPNLKDNKLLCSFSDANGDVHEINIIYYFPTTADRPFPQAYEVIPPGHVYFITGSVSFQNKDLVIYHPIFYSY